jgi:acyl-coenzyme A thioesterase PaaI-like protein
MQDSKPPAPWRVEMRALSAELKGLLNAYTDAIPLTDEIPGLIAEVRALRERIEAMPGGRTKVGTWQEIPGTGARRYTRDMGILVGTANPAAPPLRMHADGESIVGLVTFDRLYEGPPGHVHGGFIAACFDDVLGAANSATDLAGMTARLEVNYRAPAPLSTELTFRAWPYGVEGRKTFAKATLHAGDRLCAEAEALFIHIDYKAMHYRFYEK